MADVSNSGADRLMEWVSALAPLVTALSIVFAGAWGVYTYRKQLRAQASKWAVDLYQGFYKDPLMEKARELVEYRYDESLKHLLQKRVTNREIPLTDQERQDLSMLDYFLNYLEQLSYLESKKVLAKSDSSTFFSYWFDLLLKPELSELRRYLARCGYEGLSADLGFTSKEHIIFYGTLVGNSPRQDQLGLRGMLRRVGSVPLFGTLVELPTCPGYLAEGTHQYEAEMYEILSPKVFDILDEFEEYDPNDPAGSRFLRESVWVPSHRLDAWIYTISPQAIPETAQTITHPNWSAFVEATGKILPDDPPPLLYRTGD